MRLYLRVGVKIKQAKLCSASLNAEGGLWLQCKEYQSEMQRSVRKKQPFSKSI